MRYDAVKSRPESFQPLFDIGKNADRNGFDRIIRDLVEVRVSQINGCAYCVEVHTARALDHGEQQQRLDLLPFWRDLDLHSDRTRGIRPREPAGAADRPRQESGGCPLHERL